MEIRVYLKSTSDGFRSFFYCDGKNINTLDSWLAYRTHGKINIFKNENAPECFNNERTYLLNFIYAAERENKTGDVNLLNRIIRNGGIFEYTKKLETLIYKNKKRAA
jgi:hypothetical protein